MRPHRNAEDLLRTAIAYEEAQATSGWKDFISRIDRMRQQLQEDLLALPSRRRSHKEVDDNALRAMLFAIDRILEIPYIVNEEYARWRRLQDERAKLLAKAEAAGGEKIAPALSTEPGA